MVRVKVCDYTGEQIEPGTGIMYVRTDGTVLNFKDKKAENLYFEGVDPRDVEWTQTAQDYKRETPEDWFTDRLIRREQLEESDAVPATGGLRDFVALYEEFIESGGFSKTDIVEKLEDGEYLAPGEIEHDLVRFRNDLKNGRISDHRIRRIADTIADLLIDELPLSSDEGSQPDRETLAEAIRESLENEQNDTTNALL